MVARNQGLTHDQVKERMTGRDGEGNGVEHGWSPEETDKHIENAMKAHGADHLLDFLAVDEAHEALNREGKEDSHMARVLDSLGRLSKHTGWMTGSPVKNDPSEIYDWLHKINPGHYHDNEGGFSRKEFMRRFGGDLPANKAALQREIARYSITGKVDAGTTPGFHEEVLKPTADQSDRLKQIQQSYDKAKLARISGQVDTGAIKDLAPGLFEGKDESEHEGIAKGVNEHLQLSGLRQAATRRAIHMHEGGAKMKRAIELAQRYKKEGRAGVIFAHDREAIPLLRKHLDAAGISALEYHGGMSGQEKDNQRTRFKNGEGDVMIVSQAGNAGVNMQRASYAIHHDMPQTFHRVDQRQGRIDRVGQKFKTPDVHSLLIDHPDEIKARDRVERKEALHHAVMDGGSSLDDSGLSGYIRKHLERQRGAE
jgi:SNF2 family DNA or RNA helicase